MNIRALTVTKAVTALLVFVFITHYAESQETECILTVVTASTRIQYVVPESRFLASTNEWHSDVQPLPFDIHDYGIRAKEHLLQSNRFDGDLFLNQVFFSLKRKRLSPAGTNSGIMVERQVIQFRFVNMTSDGRSVLLDPVVMLLDGTIAEKRIIDNGTSFSHDRP